MGVSLRRRGGQRGRFRDGTTTRGLGKRLLGFPLSPSTSCRRESRLSVERPVLTLTYDTFQLWHQLRELNLSMEEDATRQAEDSIFSLVVEDTPQFEYKFGPRTFLRNLGVLEWYIFLSRLLLSVELA